MGVFSTASNAAECWSHMGIDGDFEILDCVVNHATQPPSNIESATWRSSHDEGKAVLHASDRALERAFLRLKLATRIKIFKRELITKACHPSRLWQIA